MSPKDDEFPSSAEGKEEFLGPYRQRYIGMVGFVPPRIEERLTQLSELDPEWLEIQESMRAHAMYPDCLDQKTVQLMLFGILANQTSDATVIHGLAARRAGATWEELQATLNIAYLFGGTSVANKGAEFLAKIAKREQELASE